MEQILKTIIGDYGVLIGLLTLIGIELTPVKVYPIKWLGDLLASWLGITKLTKEIETIKREVDVNELDRIKYEILQFSGSLRNGLKRTETDYEHIEDIFKKYTDKGGNSYIKHEMEYIRECHDKGMIL